MSDVMAVSYNPSERGTPVTGPSELLSTLRPGDLMAGEAMVVVVVVV